MLSPALSSVGFGLDGWPSTGAALFTLPGKRRNLFAYPAGHTPGFDKHHIGSKGTYVFSCAKISGGNSLNVLTTPGGMFANQIGASASFGTDGTLGPYVKLGNTAVNRFSISASTVDSTSLTAAIIFNGSVSGSCSLHSDLSGPCLIGTGMSAFGGNFSYDFTATAIDIPSTAIPVAINNVPYFYAISGRSGASVNAVVRRLDTGSVATYTASVAAFSPTTVALDFAIGTQPNASSNFGTPNVAASMRSNGLLSLAELLRWSEDPWSFWYPNRDWQGGSAISSSVAPTSFTLTGGMGTYTETGKTSLFKISETSSLGSYSNSGQPSIFRLSEVSSLGSFSQTGEASLFRDALLSSTASYVFINEPANLVWSGHTAPTGIPYAGFMGGFSLYGHLGEHGDG